MTETKFWEKTKDKHMAEAPPLSQQRKEITTLGGGCFWCIEAAFDLLEGVKTVESGYTGGKQPNPSYEAVCTPDFFGYNKNLELQYRGRIRELKNLIPISEDESDLFKAMKQISETGQGPKDQIPSAGCSIKWKYN